MPRRSGLFQLARRALLVVALTFAAPGVADAQSDGERDFDAIMAEQNRPIKPDQPISVTPWDDESPGTDASAQVPLNLFLQVWNGVRKAAGQVSGKAQRPAVVLGEAHYTGRAITGALELNVRLGVTLGRPGTWKTVPLIGEDVVLVRAKVAGQPIALSTQHGYQVWVTQRTGEISIELAVLVPTRGPRGSIEYDFRIARTPVTRFDCRFPIAGLEPRLDAAVESSVQTQGEETVLNAIVRPATRIHMVGFRDMGDSQSGKARVYVQTLNLLSVDETSLELFSVLRYTILYAGTKEFVIRVPRGVKVVSADGRGAFRYTLEEGEGGTLLRGETAFPIRDNYEISLRLEREMDKGSKTEFDAPLPTSEGVEREVGWLAIEVPGKTRLDESRRAEMTAIDTRQLPPELIRSAVSPILRAYRYHDASARQLGLVATRLPEKETASETVDQLRAFTVLSTEGDVLTEVRIQLRNRLRHSIALTVPKGTRVRSVLLDGRPAKPSLGTDGQLILPLKRSIGSGPGLKPIALQVVLETRMSELDWLGRPRLALPALDLPVSSVKWSVFVPANNLYSAPSGDISPQSYVGRASWREPAARHETEDDADKGSNLTRPGEATSAYAGAMPVRITVPKSGVRLEYERYWLDSGQPAALSFGYLRRWLLYPLVFAVGMMLVLGFWLQRYARSKRWIGGALIVVAVWPLAKVGGPWALIGFGAAGGLVLLLSHRWLGDARASLTQWARTLPARYRESRQQAAAAATADTPPATEQQSTDPSLTQEAASRFRRIRQLQVRGNAWRVALAVAMVVAGITLAGKLIALVAQLAKPLAG